MLAVVLLHAAIPFAVHPLPGLTWPTRHAVPSFQLDVLMWAALLLVMPLFFWLSGYGAAQALARDGTLAFLQSRWRRIARPGLVFAALLLPIELHVWVGGWVMDGLVPLRKLQSFKLGVYDTGLWGPSNLWYLQNLVLYSGLFAAWRSVVVPRSPRLWTDSRHLFLDSWRDRLYQFQCRFLRAWTAPQSSFILIIAGASLLALRPAILLGFEHYWWPEPVKFIWLGLFFAAGAMTQRVLRREPAAFSLQASRWRLAAGVIVLATAAPLLIAYLEHASAVAVHPCLTANPDPGQMAAIDRLFLGAVIATGVVLTTGGLTGAALSDRRESSPNLQRWSRASYWIYLIHHPITGACHLALSRTGWTAELQFILAASMTLGLTWASYCCLVEHTSIGTFLDGWQPTAAAKRTAAATKQAA